MIDSHCHLIDEKYLPEEVDQVILRAKDAGVERMVSAGTGYLHTIETLAVAERHAEVLVAAGLGYEGEIDERLRTILRNPKVVAIGECGLDERSVQKELFAFHISLAQESKLPMVVHCRNMFEQVYEMVKDKHVGGMLHCFTGNYEWMRKFVDLGWYISFGGILSFKKSHELRAVLKQTPQERILIETDSPYLAPEPVRSTRNEPANLVRIVDTVALVRNETAEHVRGYTTQNTVRLFQL